MAHALANHTSEGPRVLLTGGSGVLGEALCDLLTNVYAPVRNTLDVLVADEVVDRVVEYGPDVIVHGAAYTNVLAAEKERRACWSVNVAGTRAVVSAARAVGARLVHISTDYVFYGDGANGGRGYREDDAPGPVRNYYALSKLAAEEVARTLPSALVIRTSFRPNVWPYPVAYTDLYTSQDYVDVIAPDIALAIRHVDAISFDTLHIATERKSTFDLARRRKPDVRPGTKRETGVELPDDITLDVTRWQSLKTRLISQLASSAR